MSTTETSPFMKSLMLLESDLDAAGWDKPAGLYQFSEEVGSDPSFEKMLDLDSPVEDLQLIISRTRPPDEVKGLVLATEGWRPITVEEAREIQHPMLVETERTLGEMTEMLRTLGLNIDSYSEDEKTKAFARAWQDAIWHMAPDGRLSNLPEELRREVRSITAVTRSGEVYMVGRTRGEDPKLAQIVAFDTYCGDVPMLMRILLGRCPLEAPRQAIGRGAGNDFRTGDEV